jgi:hypothetical protein
LGVNLSFSSDHKAYENIKISGFEKLITEFNQESYLLNITKGEVSDSLFCSPSEIFSNDSLVTVVDRMVKPSHKKHYQLSKKLKKDQYSNYFCQSNQLGFKGKISVEKIKDKKIVIEGFFQDEKFRSYEIQLKEDNFFLHQIHLKNDPDHEGCGNHFDPEDNNKDDAIEVKSPQLDQSLNYLNRINQIEGNVREEYEIELGIMAFSTYFDNYVRVIAKLPDGNDLNGNDGDPADEPDDGDEFPEDGFDDRLIDESNGRIIMEAVDMDEAVFNISRFMENMVSTSNVILQHNINTRIKIKQIVIVAEDIFGDDGFLGFGAVDIHNPSELLDEFGDYEFDVPVDTQVLFYRHDTDGAAGMAKRGFLCSGVFDNALISKMGYYPYRNRPDGENIRSAVLGQDIIQIYSIFEHLYRYKTFIHELAHIIGADHTITYDSKPLACERILNHYRMRFRGGIIDASEVDEVLREFGPRLESQPEYILNVWNELRTPLGDEQVETFTDFEPGNPQAIPFEDAKRIAKLRTIMTASTPTDANDDDFLLRLNQVTGYCLVDDEFSELVLGYLPYMQRRLIEHLEDHECVSKVRSHRPIIDRFRIISEENLELDDGTPIRRYQIEAVVSDLDEDDERFYYLWKVKNLEDGRIIQAKNHRSGRRDTYEIDVRSLDNYSISVEVYDQTGLKANQNHSELFLPGSSFILTFSSPEDPQGRNNIRAQGFRLRLNYPMLEELSDLRQRLFIDFGDGSRFEAIDLNEIDWEDNLGVFTFRHLYENEGDYQAYASVVIENYEEVKSTNLRIFDFAENHSPELVSSQVFSAGNNREGFFDSQDEITVELIVNDEDRDQWVEGNLAIEKVGADVVNNFTERAFPIGALIEDQNHRLISFIIPQNRLVAGEWKLRVNLSDQAGASNSYQLGSIRVNSRGNPQAPSIGNFYLQDPISPDIQLTYGKPIKYNIIVRDFNISDVITGYIVRARQNEEGEYFVAPNSPRIDIGEARRSEGDPSIRYYEVISSRLTDWQQRLPGELHEEVFIVVVEDPSGLTDQREYRTNFQARRFFLDSFRYPQVVEPMDRFNIHYVVQDIGVGRRSFYSQLDFEPEEIADDEVIFRLPINPENQDLPRADRGRVVERIIPRLAAGTYQMTLEAYSNDLPVNDARPHGIREDFEFEVLNVPPVINRVSITKTNETVDALEDQLTPLNCERGSTIGVYDIEVSADDLNNDDLEINFRLNQGFMVVHRNEAVRNQGRLVGRKTTAFISACLDDQLQTEVCDIHNECTIQRGATLPILPLPPGNQEDRSIIPFPVGQRDDFWLPF